MRHLTDETIDRASVHRGHLSISTASCGCCSEYYTNDPEAYSANWEITQDELVKYIEREEERIEELKGYLEELTNLQISTLRHVEED